MEFATGARLDFHFLIESSHQRLFKSHFVDSKGNQASNLKLALTGKKISCKHGRADFDQRTSPIEVKKEIEKCYELIHRLGRGVVYLGSSRIKKGHPHYLQTAELGREIANLLDCTSWTGAGPGLMDAATKGALEAGKPVGGFKIEREAGEWTTSKIHPYLPTETYLTCRIFRLDRRLVGDMRKMDCTTWTCDLQRLLLFTPPSILVYGINVWVIH